MPFKKAATLDILQASLLAGQQWLAQSLIDLSKVMPNHATPDQIVAWHGSRLSAPLNGPVTSAAEVV